MSNNSSFKDQDLSLISGIRCDWNRKNLYEIIEKNRKITYGIVQPGSFYDKGKYMIRGQDYSTDWQNPETLFKVHPKIEEPYKRARVKEGDLLITIVGANTGNVAIVPKWLDGANITQTTARVAINSNHGINLFYYYFFESFFGKLILKHYEKGLAQPGLNLIDIEKFVVPVPSIPEQQKIVQILQTIDSTIEKTKEIIGKNKRIKEGLISDLFTDVQKKGIKKRLIDCSIFIRDGTHGSYEDDEKGILLLSAKDVNEGKIELDNNPRKISIKDYNSIHKKYSIQTGDILLTIVGTIGRTAIVRKINKLFTFQRSVAILRPKQELFSEYMYYYFNTEKFQRELSLCVNASAQGGVYLNKLNNLEICLPKNKDLQRDIFTKIASIDKNIEIEQKYLEKIIKIKSGLMHDLLTGKIRVAS